MPEFRVYIAMIAALAIFGPIDVVEAQSRRPRVPTQADPAAPAGQPDSGVDLNAPEIGPYLEREGLKEWVLTYRVSVFSDRPDQSIEVTEPGTNKRARTPKITPFSFETVGVVFPRVPRTGSSESGDAAIDEKSADAESFKGTLRIDGNIADSHPEMLRGFPFGVELGRWDIGERGKTTEARQIQLEVSIPVRAWKVKYNEAAALKVPWPQTWPATAQQGLESQLFVDQGFDAKGKLVKYDFKQVDRMLDLWKKEWKISDFKSVNPAALAKLVTSKVWSEVQPSGDGIGIRPRTGELMGVELQNPARTLTTGRGSEHDIVVLTVALLRKVGIPARTVIGYDAGDKSDRWLDKGTKSSKLRSWVEFCLYDEARNTVNWIPIDILKLRRLSNRPFPIDKEWRYFGTNDDLDRILPFTFHFHPPTDVISYGVPGFWGWFMTPKPIDSAEQSITMSATSKAMRGGEKEDPRPARGK